MIAIGKVIAVCISKERGTEKNNIGTCEFIENYGLKGDAHAGNWHRQVSLLSYDEVKRFREKGINIENGAFGENLLVEGFDFKAYPVGTVFECNNVVLEITQIGKKCHTKCEIYNRVGECIMPKNGVFAKVIQGGVISVGDELILKPKFRAGIITASDKAAAGKRNDESGAAIKEIIEKFGYETVSVKILPDDEALLYEEMVRLADKERVDIVFTTGGTGFSPRDNTPEATIRAATRNAPGIAEAIRYHSLNITPRAMLSRGVSVIRNKTLIVNLPGSPKAVREILKYIIPSLAHGIEIMRGEATECAETDSK